MLPRGPSWEREFLCSAQAGVNVGVYVQFFVVLCSFVAREWRALSDR